MFKQLNKLCADQSVGGVKKKKKHKAAPVCGCWLPLISSCCSTLGKPRVSRSDAVNRRKIDGGETGEDRSAESRQSQERINQEKFSPLSAQTFETFCSRIVCKESGWGKQMIEKNAGSTRLVRTNKTQRSREEKNAVTNMLKWSRGSDICSDRFCSGLFIVIPNPTNKQKNPSPHRGRGAAEPSETWLQFQESGALTDFTGVFKCSLEDSHPRRGGKSPVCFHHV